MRQLNLSKQSNSPLIASRQRNTVGIVLILPDLEAEYIDGFNFEWGYTYTLKVKVKDVG
mgnify:CR=1 FL=1